MGHLCCTLYNVCYSLGSLLVGVVEDTASNLLTTIRFSALSHIITRDSQAHCGLCKVHACIR